METVLLGWPSESPTLRLDYRRFSYAGKFVMTNAGKAVIRDPGVERPGRTDFDDDVIAAAAFNEDRTDADCLWIRYVTVRRDRRGEGLGPRLCRFVSARGAKRDYARVRIAVNNPYAYQALYRAGFTFTGESTGIAELVLERPSGGPAADRSRETYQSGLEAYRRRELDDEEHAFLERKLECAPPKP